MLAFATIDAWYAWLAEVGKVAGSKGGSWLGRSSVFLHGEKFCGAFFGI